jgi:hypothetical protein
MSSERDGGMSDTIRVWQIGPDGTEYFAARSEEEMRAYYTLQSDTAEEDLRDHFEEVENMDAEFDFDDDGEKKRMTWRKLAEEHLGCLPCQISTGYN